MRSGAAAAISAVRVTDRSGYRSRKAVTNTIMSQPYPETWICVCTMNYEHNK